MVTPGPNKSRARDASLRRNSTHASSDITMLVAGLSLAGLYTVALLVGSSALVLLVSLLALAVSMVSPPLGLVVLAFVVSMPRPLVIPTPGLHMAFLAAIALGFVFRLPIQRPRLSPPPPAVVLVLAFLLYIATQLSAGALDPVTDAVGDAIARRFSAMTVGVLLFVVAYAVLRGRSPYPVLGAVLASASLASVAAILQWADADRLFQDAIALAPVERETRVTAYFGDPNYLGAYLAITASLAVAMAVVINMRWLRVALLALAGFYSIALSLTLSRGAIVALLAGVVTAAFMRGLRTGVAVLGSTAALFVVGYPIFADARFGDSGSNVGSGLVGQLASSGRLANWLDGLDLFSSSPIFGIGFGRFSQETFSGLAAHNWFVEVLAELGIVGLTLWLLFTFALVLELAHSTWAARTVGFAVLAAWVVGSLSIEIPKVYQISAPVLITVAAALSASWWEARLDESPTNRPTVARSRSRIRSKSEALRLDPWR